AKQVGVGDDSWDFVLPPELAAAFHPGLKHARSDGHQFRGVKTKSSQAVRSVVVVLPRQSGIDGSEKSALVAPGARRTTKFHDAWVHTAAARSVGKDGAERKFYDIRADQGGCSTDGLLDFAAR